MDILYIEMIYHDNLIVALKDIKIYCQDQNELIIGNNDIDTHVDDNHMLMGFIQIHCVMAVTISSTNTGCKMLCVIHVFIELIT